MLRYSFVLLAGLCAAGPAAAAGWAEALFDSLNKDFGSVPHGQTLTHYFRIHNATNEAVRISSLRVSCGCVTAQAPKPVINPGEDAILSATMDTARFFNVRTVTIFVQFDRPSFQEVRLWVQADSRSDFSVSPGQLAFGTVKRGEAATATVTVTFFGNGAAQVVEARSESNYIQPKLTPVTSGSQQIGYQLTATLRPDVPVGKWYTDVWLKTNQPTMPQLRVPLTVEIESALSVSPEATNFGRVAVNGEVEKRVIVRGIKPFKITGFGGTDTEVTVQESGAGAKATHVLVVKLKAAKAGDVHRTVRLTTDLAEDNQIEFHVNAQVGQ